MRERLRYLLAGVAAVVMIVTGVALALPAHAANIDTMTFPASGSLTVEVTATPAGSGVP